jgi:hypothetical protein
MQLGVRSWAARGFQLAVLLCGGWLLAGPSLAQEEGYQEAVPFKGAEDRRFRELQSGKVEPPFSAEDKALIDKGAKWFANRLTWPQYQGAPAAEGDKTTPADKKAMYQIVDEALKQFAISENPAKPLGAAQQEYMKEFGKAMTKYLKRVVKNEKPITRVNAARLLSHLCKAGIDDSADVLIDVLKDPNENDGVKLYAARGLKEMFTAKPPDPKRENRAILTLLESLEQRSSRTAKKPRPEEDGERYVRREVVRALGDCRYPALGNLPKQEVPAWWLLRVMRKDKITPEPNLSEQVEAAIAVCNLQPKLAKDYNVDFVAHQVGWFIVEYCDAANNPTTLRPPNDGISFHWKKSASDLATAMDKLAENAAKDTYVGNLVKTAKVALVPIELGKPATTKALTDWLQKNPPKNTVVVKSAANTTISVPEPGK